jgi:Flp pilus assembly pilin Flp
MLQLQIRNWVRRQEGQDLTEYALLLGLIALICIVAITTLGTRIAAFWQKAASQLPTP